MKNSILFTIVLFSIFSCSKNEVNSHDSITPLAKEVLKQSDFTTMRQAYQLLTLDEKASIWETKFKIVLKNDKYNLSKKQYEIVTLINDFLLDNSFKKIRQNPEIGEKFLSDNLPYFQKYFTKVELYMLLQCCYFDDNFSLKNSSIYAKTLSESEYSNVLNIETNLIAPPNNCECKYDLGCPGWNNTCEKDKGSCNHTTDGCGIFGTSECNGRCYLSPA